MVHLICPFSAVVTPFPSPFIIKGNARRKVNEGGNHFSVLLTPFPDIAFIKKEATGCINEEAIDAINEAAIGAIIAPRYSLTSLYFISCFTVSVARSINRPLNLLVALRF